MATSLAILLTAAPAHARIERLYMQPTTPANDATIEIPATGCGTLAFSVVMENAPPGGMLPPSLFIEVTTANTAGQDGTLTNDTPPRVASGTAVGMDAAKHIYTTTLSGSFCTPGTYYFQLSRAASGGQCGFIGGDCVLASDVFRFTLVAPPPPPPPPPPPVAPPPPPPPVVAPPPPPPAVAEVPALSLETARAATRTAIRALTGRRPSLLRRQPCARGGSTVVSCPASWRDRVHTYTGTLTLRLDGSELAVRFTGTRTTRRCSRGCARRVTLT